MEPRTNGEQDLPLSEVDAGFKLGKCEQPRPLPRLPEGNRHNHGGPACFDRLSVRPHSVCGGFGPDQTVPSTPCLLTAGTYSCLLAYYIRKL